MTEYAPVLILIDVQRGFDAPVWGNRSCPQAEANIAGLLSAWRGAGHPVIHIAHASKLPDSPLAPGQSGYDFKPEAAPMPGEPVLVKSVNSAFIGTDLEARLHAAGSRPVVIAGLTVDHCVSTTVRMAGNLGFTVFLAEDACAAFDRRATDGTLIPADTVHKVQTASLHGEFCTALPAADLIRRFC